MYKNELVEIKKLFLNEKNYRIDFERYNTVKSVVEKLFEDEDIIGMIRSVVNFHGMYPNDLPIVIPKNGIDGYTVMEGNRRVLAAKVLLGEVPVPEQFKKVVETLRTNMPTTSLDALRFLNVIIYDENDSGYLKIIGDKHSSINYERWGQISQWHFFRDTYISNIKNLEKTSNDLGKTKSEVSNYIHFYNLINYIRSLRYWDDKKLRNEIEKNKLKPTKFTRPLGSKIVLNELNIEFGEDLELKIPQVNKAEFDYVLCAYAEASLIKDKSNDDYIYTRSEPSQVVELIQSWKGEYLKNNSGEENIGKDGKETQKDNTQSSKGQEEGKIKNEETNKKREKAPIRKKKGMHFSKLNCTIDSKRLVTLSNELSKINATHFPAATIMLTRSLLEASLLHQIEKKGLKNDYYTIKGKDGLKKIINFSISQKSKLFIDPKSANGLEYLETSKYKNFMDDIVHNKWIDPHESDVANIAGKIGELLKAIITDKA